MPTSWAGTPTRQPLRTPARFNGEQVRKIIGLLVGVVLAACEDYGCGALTTLSDSLEQASLSLVLAETA